MNVYANDNDQSWPYLGSIVDGTGVTAGTAVTTWPGAASSSDAAKVTMNTFEFLAYTTGGDIPGKSFACPSNAQVKPPSACANAANIASGLSTAGNGATWSMPILAAGNATNVQAYAYDWAVPANGSSIRVVTGDRPKVGAATGDMTNHKTVAMCAFADGHVGNINKSSGTVSGVTVLAQNNVANAWVAINKDAGTDENIYDLNGDGGTGFAAGAGSSTRAYLK